MAILLLSPFRWRSQQQSVVESFSKGQCRKDVSPEEGNGNHIPFGSPGSVRQQPGCCKGYANNPAVSRENRRVVEKNDGGVSAVRCRNGFGLIGFVGQDGISRYWNEQQSCWLPIPESRAPNDKESTPPLRSG
jgi:hypothetical protein